MLYGFKRFLAALNKSQINFLDNRDIANSNLANFAIKQSMPTNFNGPSSINHKSVRNKFSPIKPTRKLNGNSRNGSKQNNQSESLVSNAKIILFSGGAIAWSEYEHDLSGNRINTGEMAHCLDLEDGLKQSLEVAYLNNDYNEQCKGLANLAKWHLSQKNYSAAAKLLNGALVIVQKYGNNIIDAEQLEKELLTQLKIIEPTFIIEEIQTDYKALPENQGINLQHKQQLWQLREEVRKELQELKWHDGFFDPQMSNKTQRLFKKIAERIKSIVSEMIQDCIDLMPTKPPCGYALIGTGSLAGFVANSPKT